MGGIPWRGAEYSALLAKAGALGLSQAAEYLRSKTLPRTPKRDGDLRGSAQVINATIFNLEAWVTFDTPYAVRQHEELDYFHPVGEAKFLERTLQDEAKTIQRIIAAPIGRIT